MGNLPRDHQAPQEAQVLLEGWEIEVQMVLKAHQAMQVLQAYRVHRVSQVRRAQQELLVQQALREMKVIKDPRETLVQWENQVAQVNQVYLV